MRYLGLDLARSVAVIFAIVGHAMMATNIEGEGWAVQSLRFFLGVSPPVFFCLFGCMLQLVYVRQYTAGRGDRTVPRLLTRALQCWLLYVLSCAGMCIAAGLPFSYFVRCALLLGDTPFTDILKFYVMLLIASGPLVHVSLTRGVWPLVVLVLLIQLAFPWFSQLPPMQGFPGAETLSAFLYGGRYLGHTGPSVIHGLGFVVFGMALGRIWQARPGHEFLLSGRDGSVRAGFAGLLIVLSLAVYFGGHNLADADERILLRNTNHPVYLLFGCVAAVVFIEAFTAIRRATGIDEHSVLMVFGRTSLFTFCFGNIILYALHLWDPAAPPDPARFMLGTASALLLSIAYGHFREWKGLKSAHPAARAYRWIVDDFAADIVRFLTRPLLGDRRREVRVGVQPLAP